MASFREALAAAAEVPLDHMAQVIASTALRGEQRFIIVSLALGEDMGVSSLTLDDLVRVTSMPEKRVQKHLDEMISRGEVRDTGRNRYGLVWSTVKGGR